MPLIKKEDTCKADAPGKVVRFVDKEGKYAFNWVYEAPTKEVVKPVEQPVQKIEPEKPKKRK